MGVDWGTTNTYRQLDFSSRGQSGAAFSPYIGGLGSKAQPMLGTEYIGENLAKLIATASEGPLSIASTKSLHEYQTSEYS